MNLFVPIMVLNLFVGFVLYAFFLQWTVLLKTQNKHKFRKLDMHFSSIVWCHYFLYFKFIFSIVQAKLYVLNLLSLMYKLN